MSNSYVITQSTIIQWVFWNLRNYFYYSKIVSAPMSTPDSVFLWPEQLNFLYTPLGLSEKRLYKRKYNIYIYIYVEDLTYALEQK